MSARDVGVGMSDQVYKGHADTAGTAEKQTALCARNSDHMVSKALDAHCCMVLWVRWDGKAGRLTRLILPTTSGKPGSQATAHQKKSAYNTD